MVTKIITHCPDCLSWRHVVLHRCFSKFGYWWFYPSLSFWFTVPGDTVIASRTKEVEIKPSNAMPIGNMPLGEYQLFCVLLFLFYSCYLLLLLLRYHFLHVGNETWSRRKNCKICRHLLWGKIEFISWFISTALQLLDKTTEKAGCCLQISKRIKEPSIIQAMV